MARDFRFVAICRAPTVERMRGEMFHAASRADLLEIRLDMLEPGARAGLAECFKAPPRPTIATARRPEDGGEWKGTEGERIETLEEAAAAGADWVDLEWGSGALGLLDRAHGAGRLVSHHQLEGFPEDPAGLGDALAGAGGDAVKLALACARPREVLRLRAVCRDLDARGVEVAAIPVGPRASWGRLWAPAWGSWGGYFGPPARNGSLRPAEEDLGIVSLAEARDVYDISRVGRRTRVFAVAGQGVASSLSPRIHMAALRTAGLDGLYVHLELEEEDLEDVVLHPMQFPFEGLSVTNPFKEVASRLVTRLEGAAAEAGALNTVRREADGTTTGFNTDGQALRELIEARTDLEGARAVVLGAGGAARGAVQALIQAGARVLVLNRTPERAERLARELGCDWNVLPDAQEQVAGADLLVNATPLGDRTGPGGAGVNPVSEAVLRGGPGGLVVDLVYRPRVTRLLREASRAGWKVLDGTEVLLRQAALQFQIWNGQEPDLEAMRAAL